MLRRLVEPAEIEAHARRTYRRYYACDCQRAANPFEIGTPEYDAWKDHWHDEARRHGEVVTTQQTSGVHQ